MKNIFKSLLFIAILYALLSLISFAITFGARHSPMAPLAKINKMMSHEIDPEIMILGASTAWVNFNPSIISRMTGLSVFNFGLDGTPFVEYKGLAEEFISYSKKCRYIIIALNLWEFSEREGLYQSFKFYPYIENDHIYNALYALQPGLTWKMRHVPFYKLTAYTGDFYQWVETGWQAAAGKKITTHEKNGFFPMHQTWENIQELKNLEAKDIRIPIEDERLAMFREFASRCNSRGFVVIAVIPPIQRDGKRLIINIGEVRDSIVKSITPQTIFLDYTNSDMCNDKTYFYNNTHLNYIGADRFSTIFAEDFQSFIKNGSKTGKLPVQGKVE